MSAGRIPGVRHDSGIPSAVAPRARTSRIGATSPFFAGENNVGQVQDPSQVGSLQRGYCWIVHEKGRSVFDGVEDKRCGSFRSRSLTSATPVIPGSIEKGGREAARVCQEGPGTGTGSPRGIEFGTVFKQKIDVNFKCVEKIKVWQGLTDIMREEETNTYYLANVIIWDNDDYGYMNNEVNEKEQKEYFKYVPK